MHNNYPTCINVFPCPYEKSSSNLEPHTPLQM